MSRGDVNMDHQDFLMEMGVFDSPSDERSYKDYLDSLYYRAQEEAREVEDQKIAMMNFQMELEKEKVA